MKLSGAGGPVSAGAGATGADGFVDNVASAGEPAGNGADGTDAGGFADDNVGVSAGRFLGDGANAAGSAGDSVGEFTNNLAGADAGENAGGMVLWLMVTCCYG